MIEEKDMREVVNIHVGQCGNQIGSAFWNLLLLEHEHTPDNDPALSSFFHFAPSSRNSKSQVMKARALLIDMECGPLQETMRSSIGSLFDETQYIMDVSGAGNNFAQGYYYYGPRYHEYFHDGVQKNLEKCESIQAFFLSHSLGGGTGSGVGTYVLSLIHDEFPKITRFSTCVLPSEENDVITSPYNILLSTKQLIQCADCVFPLNNSSLYSIYQAEHPESNSSNSSSTSAAAPTNAAEAKRSRSRGFDGINNIAARMLCNITASSRFHGEMNVDINEIYTNLIPFPKLHFLMTAMNIRYPQSKVLQGPPSAPPLPPTNNAASGKKSSKSSSSTTSTASTTTAAKLPPRIQDYSRNLLQRGFNDIMSPKGQLSGFSLNPSEKRAVTIASAFITRGPRVILSDFIHCVLMAQQSLTFPKWNENACKVSRYWRIIDPAHVRLRRSECAKQLHQVKK